MATVNRALCSISELATEVNEWCSRNAVEPANGQAGDLVTARNIRFYSTVGLLDAPESGGRGFGEKHYLQLVAIRLLQAQGLPLRRIRELLFGRTVAELREVQKRGLIEARGVSASSRIPIPAGDELWRATPLDDDFMIISRRGTALSAAQRDAILRALHSTPKGSRK
jgi:DNA-binding transcriptional MerR regulator